jgi:hypothetical protein
MHTPKTPTGTDLSILQAIQHASEDTTPGRGSLAALELYINDFIELQKASQAVSDAEPTLELRSAAYDGLAGALERERTAFRAEVAGGTYIPGQLGRIEELARRLGSRPVSGRGYQM